MIRFAFYCLVAVCALVGAGTLFVLLVSKPGVGKMMVDEARQGTADSVGRAMEAVGLNPPQLQQGAAAAGESHAAAPPPTPQPEAAEKEGTSAPQEPPVAAKPSIEELMAATEKLQQAILDVKLQLLQLQQAQKK